MGEGLKRVARLCGGAVTVNGDGSENVFDENAELVGVRRRMPDGTTALEVLVPDGYIAGLGRDHPYPVRAHLYQGTFPLPGLPMCRYGWNRDGGTSYSIWRGNFGRKGVCRICLRRARLGLDGVPAWGKDDDDVTGEDAFTE